MLINQIISLSFSTVPQKVAKDNEGLGRKTGYLAVDSNQFLEAR